MGHLPWARSTQDGATSTSSVCAEPLHRERRMVLGEALAVIPTPPSGGDLEFSLVTEAAVRARSAAPSFEVHVNTHEEPFVVYGSDRPGVKTW